MKKYVLYFLVLCTVLFAGCASTPTYTWYDESGEVVYRSTDEKCLNDIRNLAELTTKCLAYAQTCKQHEGF